MVLLCYKYGSRWLSENCCGCVANANVSVFQTYTATGDRFFVDGSITVTEVSGWGKSHSCSITDIQKVPVKAKTDLGEITFMVIKAFTVRAHADCGSGYGPVARGETISQECTVSAKTMKYTNN